MTNYSKNVQILLLDVIEFIVDNGNINIWQQISSKDFLMTLLNLLKTRNEKEIQFKILGLIKKWGLYFQNKRNQVPNFFEIYNNLNNSGVVFPENYMSSYQKYLQMPPPSNNYSNYSSQGNNNFSNDFNDDFNNNNNNNYNDNDNFYENDDFDYVESFKGILIPSKFEHKYNRLVNYLQTMIENISLANDMIDNHEIEGLKEVMSPLRQGNNTLIDTIAGDRLKNEKLMEITIGVSEDINRTLNRYEMITLRKKPD